MNTLSSASGRGLSLRKSLTGICLTAALLAMSPAQAVQPVPQNLTQMITAADLIVSGIVKSVTDGIADGVPYTEITLRVQSSAKQGLESGSDFSFRQFGLLKSRRMEDGKILLPMRIEGMPEWSVDEQVMVFLNPAARLTGLRSPVGLAQGKLRIASGRMANDVHNHGLFAGVEIKAALSQKESAMLNKNTGDVDESTFMGLVTRAVNEQWVETGVMK